MDSSSFQHFVKFKGAFDNLIDIQIAVRRQPAAKMDSLLGGFSLCKHTTDGSCANYDQIKIAIFHSASLQSRAKCSHELSQIALTPKR
jgi:hypothetical protein